ncbi:MAG TPA: hypothetical protein VMU94_17175 [Streptosporangiaceae bacterium]|nr:hypothetical protein [Streptosporangiaceae bacterium]
MDRVKQQASTLAQQANQGMARIDNLPAQRRADQLLRALGVAVLAERTGRAAGDNEAQITQILADLAQHEGQYNVNLVQQSAQAQAQQMQQQQWQAQQAQMQGPGDFLTSAPPLDPNASAAPVGPAPGYGGGPGYGGQPAYPQGGQAGFPGAAPASPQQGGFPGAAPQQGGFPGAAPASFPQQGGPAGFPPATAFPEAAPLTPAESGDEPGSDQGQSGFFPPASGV